MREKAIRRLIEIVEESEIDILEVNTWWRRIKITRRQSQNGSAPAHNNGHSAEQSYLTPMSAPPAAPQPAAAPPAPAVEAESAPSNLIDIKSPMVGTFYTAPSPDSQAYVKVGDSVSVGSVVCIVEAMKLMNEIESEVSGKSVKALVENGQPVEFGQPLFQIDPTA